MLSMPPQETKEIWPYPRVKLFELDRAGRSTGSFLQFFHLRIHDKNEQKFMEIAVAAYADIG